ncbi:MAG: ImmA/IrrE family metallo-endopeptidase [Acetobacter sp.]|nr:ImmA/IrrE family metallo-endopeptidase [Acetobacter sp.]
MAQGAQAGNHISRYGGPFAGRRATLAHELGHFVIDRDGALPVAEATGKFVKTPTKIEQRAGAFAAEFLLPRRIACSLLRRCDDVQITLDELTAKYGVSTELALWQLKNHPDDAAGPSPVQRAWIKSALEQLARDRRLRA